MNKKDQEAIANLYMESSYPSAPNGSTFDDNTYTDMRKIVYGMEGSHIQEVIDAISQQLDIRIENLSPELQSVFLKLYKLVNPDTGM